MSEVNVTDLFTSYSFQRSATQFRRVFKFSPVKDQREKMCSHPLLEQRKGHTLLPFLTVIFLARLQHKEKQHKKNHKNLNTARKTLIFLTVGINIETDAACITGHQMTPSRNSNSPFAFYVLPCARPFCASKFLRFLSSSLPFLCPEK